MRILGMCNTSLALTYDGKVMVSVIFPSLSVHGDARAYRALVLPLPHHTGTLPLSFGPVRLSTTFKLVHYAATITASGRLAFNWNTFLFFWNTSLCTIGFFIWHKFLCPEFLLRSAQLFFEPSAQMTLRRDLYSLESEDSWVEEEKNQTPFQKPSSLMFSILVMLRWF